MAQATAYTEIEFGYSAPNSEQTLQEAFNEVVRRLERANAKNRQLREQLAQRAHTGHSSPETRLSTPPATPDKLVLG
jgi:hypothetical protein